MWYKNNKTQKIKKQLVLITGLGVVTEVATLTTVPT